ncbi:MAG: M1 family aminopeptidase [Gloeobacterales cyanobacterium]
MNQPTSPYKSFSLPGAKPQYNPDKPGLVEHISLNLDLDLEAESLRGQCKVRLVTLEEGVRSLTLDAVHMTIGRVYLGESQELIFSHDGQRVYLTLPEGVARGTTLEITLEYAVEKPQRGIYFIKPNDHYPNKPVQVWTQGEDEDSRFWFPCFDYPGQLATSEITVTVPKPYQAISNGVLAKVTETKKTKTYHWKQEQVHPTYLMTLVVGMFAEIQDEWDGIEVPYYVTPGREEEARRTMGKTPRMIQLFSEKFGVRYPFPRYAQVCVDDFIFGGMENTSCTVLTDRCLLDEQAAKEYCWSEDLVAHELVHQWFGDLVVIKHWSHAWIKEGAASYFEALWREHEYGQEDADYFRYLDTHSYFDEDKQRYRRPIVTNVYKEAIELYDRHLYQKGAAVYHMLRHYLGETGFFRFIQTFLEDNRHRTVETVDLLRAIEKATGRNLLPLFEQYVFKGGHPEFKVSYSWDQEGSYAKVTVQQKQTVNDLTVLFDLNIPVSFNFQDGTPKVFPLHIHQTEQTFCFPLETKPLFFSFDPRNHILKTLELEVSVEDLKAQLQNDPDVMSRIFAAQALAKKSNPSVAKALESVLLDETVFWGVRAEVASALSEAKRDYACDALRQALPQVQEDRVRKAILTALATDPTEKTFSAVEPFTKGVPSYFVRAAAAKTIGKTKHEAAYKVLKKVLEKQDSWNETVRAAAVDGLAELKDNDKARDLLMSKTALGIPQPLRLAAIRALGRWGEGKDDSKVLNCLADIAKEGFFLTRLATIASLKSLQSPKALALLQQIASNDPDGRVERTALEAIEALRASVAQSEEVKKLREAIEELQKNNQELKSRLDILESK